mmetsp:Transcript_36640/g.105613  ORF Transcript_36640/g.105613 Transcript_36640/m.105613 type:complete len:338 (+) Transcript_36640:259-1272(+)
MALKIGVLRKAFFFAEEYVQWFNIFDLFVVLVSSFDMFFLRVYFGWNMGSVSLARLTRLARATRSVRVVGLSKLSVLIQTFMVGFGALGWSVVVLAFFVVIGGAFVCQCVQIQLQEEGYGHDAKQWAFNSYGTAGRSMWTMFELTFSGGWPNYVQPLVDKFTPYYTLFFIGYVVIVVFAALRVATALLIRDTMAAAAVDANIQLELEMQDKKDHTGKLRSMFEVMDTSGDGRLSIEEFHRVYEKPEAKTLMKMLDIHIGDIDRLFEILDDGDGRITFEEFLEGLLRLKGNARSMDVVAIMHDCNQILLSCRALESRFFQGAAPGPGDLRETWSRHEI